MFEQFIQRENGIFEILQVFLDNKLDFVVVGGYAISAFKHRFSVDADIVIRNENLDKLDVLLNENNFRKIITKDLKGLYDFKFIRYQKKEELTMSIDLLVNGLRIRQTDFEITFDDINKNSIKKKIKGIEKEVNVKIPIKELMIAVKLHSGRLTDFRDIVAISKDINLDRVKELLGKKNDILKENIKKLLNLLDKKEFIDSFKGVFVEKKFDIDIKEINKLKDLL